MHVTLIKLHHTYQCFLLFYHLNIYIYIYTVRNICIRFNIEVCEVDMHCHYWNLKHIDIVNLIYTCR